MAMAGPVAAAWLVAGLGLQSLAWAGELSSIPSCRIGGVELIVGGQSGSRDCQTDQRRKQAPANASTSATEAGIPAGLQQTRDQERRRILEAELTHEQDNLAQLQRAGAAREPAAVTRAQENIAALNRELTRLNPSR